MFLSVLLQPFSISGDGFPLALLPGTAAAAAGFPGGFAPSSGGWTVNLSAVRVYGVLPGRSILTVAFSRTLSLVLPLNVADWAAISTFGSFAFAAPPRGLSSPGMSGASVAGAFGRLSGCTTKASGVSANSKLARSVM